jgi:hypothetical protein
MKTDEQFLKDRLEMFESGGWLDLIEELQNMEISVRDVDTMNNEKDLWHAKGQLYQLRLLLSLESAAKLTMDNLETDPL